MNTEHEYRYVILKAIQTNITETVVKDLDNRHIYTGHSLLTRTVEQLQYDMTSYTLREIDRASKLKLLVS